MILARYSASPMLPLGRPMTSAATPLFQQMPSATLHPCRKAGSTAGSQIARRRRPAGRRNTAAISSSCTSAPAMPVRTAPYSTGNTIRKLISTERALPRTQTSARMIKLATGVALTSCITGASSASAALHRAAHIASTTLTTAPSKKPSKMRPELKHTRCQKSALGSSCTKVRSACTGDTKNTSCPMAIAAACQTASQNATASRRRKNCLFCFINCPLPLPIIRYSIPYRPAKGNDLCTTCGGSAFNVYTFIQPSYA